MVLDRLWYHKAVLLVAACRLACTVPASCQLMFLLKNLNAKCQKQGKFSLED
jgi:hypothetical protein